MDDGLPFRTVGYHLFQVFLPFLALFQIGVLNGWLSIMDLFEHLYIVLDLPGLLILACYVIERISETRRLVLPYTGHIDKPTSCLVSYRAKP